MERFLPRSSVVISWESAFRAHEGLVLVCSQTGFACELFLFSLIAKSWPLPFTSEVDSSSICKAH